MAIRLWSFKEKVRRNIKVLKRLKKERPQTYEALIRWFKGKEHWNAWAEDLLARKKALEQRGHWKARQEAFEWLYGENEVTQAWLDKAKVDFSELQFVTEGTRSDEALSGAIIHVDRINFAEFSFPGFITFRGCTFSGCALLKNCTFFGNANFQESHFLGNTLFNGSTFYGVSLFDSIIFSGHTSFKGSMFSDDTAFRGSTFSNYTTFMDCTFSGDADFWGSAFVNNTTFRESTFAGYAIFVDNTFSGNAIFQGITFSGYATFLDSTFSGEADFRLCVFERPVSFARTRFGPAAIFCSILSQKSFSLRDAHFVVAPDFNEAAFHAPPVLDYVKIAEQLTEKRWLGPFTFKSVPEAKKKAREISRNFRALGKMAHEARDWLNEMEFFAQEIRARRFGEDFPLGELRPTRKFLVWLGRRWKLPFARRWMFGLSRWVRSNPKRGPNVGRFWFGLFYEKLSDFGRSVARPLGLWAIVTVFFAGLYAFLANAQGGWNWLDPVYLSLRHAFVVSGIVRNEHLQDVLKAMFGGGSSGLAIIMLLQTLVSAVFLFFFLLALRNHFRIR